MTQRLQINEKEYLTSSVLAKKFNYTSDYISKLARDEKVLGTRLGRQWFIEPESLRTYIQQLEVEKKIAQEKLSRQRKLERIQSTSCPETKILPKVDRMFDAVVAAQALVIVMCGLLVGTIFFSIANFDLHFADAKRGITVLAAHVMEGVVPKSLVFYNQLSPVASSVLSVRSGSELVLTGAGPQFELDGLYAVFPRYSGETFSQATSSVASSTAPLYEIDLPFSDEVEVVKVDEKVFVRPVFRDASGDLYELSVTPVLDNGTD